MHKHSKLILKQVNIICCKPLKACSTSYKLNSTVLKKNYEKIKVAIIKIIPHSTSEYTQKCPNLEKLLFCP